MDIVKYSIEKPVTVLAVVIMVVLFGIISLQRLPYQLSPTVVEPEISVTTIWRGATPYEMEREIIEEQENVLKGIPGLMEMESDCYNNRSEIMLRFKIGTDVDDALLKVSSKLNEVESYPDGVDNPVINASGATTRPVIWVLLKTMEGNPRSINTYRTYFEEEIVQFLERLEGVASLLVGGGLENEMHIILKQDRLAAYGITISEMIRVIDSENKNISAGNLGVGRRDFRIRTTGEFKKPGDIENIVISSTGRRRILLKDVAEVKPGYQKARFAVMHNGDTAIAIGFRPEPGANVLAMTARARKAVDWVNETKLRPKNIEMVWVADQTRYINGAIGIIKQNIMVGGLLAVFVLLVFVRSLRSTMVVSTAIPISIIGTFVSMYLLDRNLNVVSLAAIAFAVGMLVDNAIVVIENIDRHRGMGKSGVEAAYDGTREVWGAILSSTLTTVAVFLPVIFLKEEAGQLFKDIAIAIVFAITMSLFVSVSVIPMLAAKLFGRDKKKKPKGKGVIGGVGAGLAGALMALVSLAIRNWFTRIVTVAALVAVAVFSVKALTPKMEYLPQGNRNIVMTIIVPPPGLSYQERKEIGEKLFAIADPYFDVESHEGIPGISNMFYISGDRFFMCGAMSVDWNRPGELLPLFKRAIASLPGMFGVTMQVGILETRFGQGRTINVNVSGAELNSIIRASGAMFMQIRKTIPGSQVRPVPSIELMYPEVNIVPDRDRLRAVSMSTGDLGVVLDVLMDGRKIGDFKVDGQKKIDLILKSDDEDIVAPEDLFNRLIVAPNGRSVPLSSLASLERAFGITRIRHLERKRTITLQVTPPVDIPLESAMETIKSDVFGPLRAKGLFKGLDVRMGGAAGKLTQAREAMQWNFVLAAVIAYLLMASLFGNFIYPLIIMLTVPLAGAGGFMGLKLLNLFVTPQPMDILTMLGFVILIGVVVNNAILIVHQALNNLRYGGMDHKTAVLESTKSRLRPIYMSATTSIFGMLPLVIFQGAGTELYKGLGSVILGGIAVSTVFTVFVIPAILMFVIKMEKVRGGASDVEKETVGEGASDVETEKVDEGDPAVDLEMGGNDAFKPAPSIEVGK